MHLDLILLAFGVAYCMRLLTFRPSQVWSVRWQHTLGVFLFPLLWMLATAVTVLAMDKRGQMLGIPVGEVGHACALAFLGGAAVCLLWRAGQGWRSLRQLRHCPTVVVGNTEALLLETSMPFAAQIGFWQPQLVVSQGLLSQLSAEQIQAVVAHEQAHVYYRDTFWFFWLGWFRQLMAWLPHTEPLWQELLLLREIRADHWAAQRVDALLIAEALFQMAQMPSQDAETLCAAMSTASTVTRLEERIDRLLSASPALGQRNHALLWWLLPALIPLLSVALHR